MIRSHDEYNQKDQDTTVPSQDIQPGVYDTTVHCLSGSQAIREQELS